MKQKKYKVKLYKFLTPILAYTPLFISEFEESAQSFKFKIGTKNLFTDVKVRYSSFDEDCNKIIEVINESYAHLKIKV